MLTLVQIASFIILFVMLLIVIFRKQPAQSSLNAIQDLSRQIGRVDTRSETLDAALRIGFAEIRREFAEQARASREAAAQDFARLRVETTGNVTTLGSTLQAALNEFRADNTLNAGALSSNVHQQLEHIAHRLNAFVTEANRNQIEARESLNCKLIELGSSTSGNLDRIRATVEDRLERLNTTNAAKLEEMRVTVDEKLQATLQTRLTESFGQVTMHLGEVQKGLGEMKVLATGVGDLKKVLSNVSRRGGVGEFLVGQQLEQMFSREQYLKQVSVRPGSSEKVDFALKIPEGEVGKFVLLPIDAKFPTSDWERLEHAHEHGTPADQADAGRAFERAIRAQGKSICEKYIHPPSTTSHAIMVLPTEGLYAEVARRPGLQADVQSNCRVTIAGPSTFMAILTSFQMGFHTLAIQRKGDEVWRVLSSTRNEFEKFGGLMDKVKRQVDTVQNTLGEIGSKTRTINRTLKNVSSADTGVPVSNMLGFEDIAGVAPLLAATSDRE